MLIELPLDGTKRGITLKAAKTHKRILVPNVREDEDYYEGIHGIVSELAVPVETEDRFIGVLDVESKQANSFSEKDATLLQILAWHSATAISNLTKRAEIEKSSNRARLYRDYPFQTEIRRESTNAGRRVKLPVNNDSILWTKTAIEHKELNPER
jgi:GAF domain-containing protein